MIDRGIIKWQPFNSCFSGDKIVQEITYDKNKKDYPILSEDQLVIIEEKINEALSLKINVTIDFFYDGIIKRITGKITNINKQEKKICLNNKNIYFKQILKIHY